MFVEDLSKNKCFFQVHVSCLTPICDLLPTPRIYIEKLRSDCVVIIIFEVLSKNRGSFLFYRTLPHEWVCVSTILNMLKVCSFTCGLNAIRVPRSDSAIAEMRLRACWVCTWYCIADHFTFVIECAIIVFYIRLKCVQFQFHFEN
jgi:hypothetical protein